MTINLIEDNGGNLYVGTDGEWYDVTPIQNDSMFIADAGAIATGGTNDWTVNKYSDAPAGEIVATWKDGIVEIDTPHCGRAAQNYLRLDLD